MTHRFRSDCEGFARRDFLKIGAAGLFGLSLPQLLQLEARARAASPGSEPARRRADSVIMIWLAGGPATIDMWDLKPGAPDGIRGEFRQINTSADGVAISQHLPLMAQVMHKSTVVRSLAHTIPSHGPATVFMTTGNRPTPAIQYPSLGSLVTRLMPAAQGVPPFISFSEMRNGTAGLAGYLGTAYNPFIVEGVGADPRGATAGNLRVRGITLPTGFTLEQLENRDRLLQQFDQGLAEVDRRADLVEGLDAFHQQALDILRSNRTRNAFNLSDETPALRSRYGNNPFGLGALAARRLVDAGVRFVTVSLGGWDTHGQNFTNLRTRLLPQLDQTLSALIEDLDDRGMLENTVMYCAGEFGRTPRINQNAGRDHWARSMAVLLAGGGFRRGYAHGTTDIQGMAPATEPCTPDDVSSTIFHCLGLDPHQELQTPTGRPIQLFREGRVINRLLA
jgi:hypothetical protein